MKAPEINQIPGTTLSRRRLLRNSLLASGALASASLLASCGGDDDDEPDAADDPTSVEPTPESGGEATPQEESTEETSEDVDESTPTTEAQSSENGGEGVFGGTFVAALETPPPTLDFMTSGTAATRIAVRPAVETLVAQGEDFTPVPMLADSWEVSDDGLTYTFALRENVPFHNDKIMTADDVIASFERFMSVTTRAAEFEIVGSYEETDEHTVVITLTTPSLGFIDSMAYPLTFPGILPREVIESIADETIQLEQIVGTGPYRMVEWIPDQLIRFERFDGYSSRDEPMNGLGGGKTAYFDEIQYLPVPEAGSRLAGLETGEYDYDARPSPTEYDRLVESSEMTPYINELAQMDVFFYNHDDPISGNLQFRQAIQAVIDHEHIATAITNGKSDFFGLDPSIWFPPTPWHNDEGADLYNQVDLERAQQLLEESGYDGEEIILLTNRNYDSMYKNIITLDDILQRELGINTKVEVLDWPAQNERTDGGTTGWHIAPTWHQSQPLFGPSAWTQFMETGNARGYSDPDMDAAFESFRTAETQEDRIDAAHTVQRIFYENPPMVKVCNTYAIEALRASIQGYQPYYEPRFWNCWREE